MAASYESDEAAGAYQRKYRRSLIRHLSNWREKRLLRRMLERLGPCDSILDCPCGAGRTLPVVTPFSTRVYGGDLALSMVRAASTASPFARLAVADSMALPFPAKAIDAVVCFRLLHHFPDEADRRRILAEAARVAKRAVIATFADAETRRGRRARSRRRPISAGTLRADAEAAGLVLEPPVLRVGGLFSFVALAYLRVED